MERARGACEAWGVRVCVRVGARLRARARVCIRAHVRVRALVAGSWRGKADVSSQRPRGAKLSTALRTAF
eukprot:717396-Pleurochrysis_carterae.AAC.2